MTSTRSRLPRSLIFASLLCLSATAQAQEAPAAPPEAAPTPPAAPAPPAPPAATPLAAPDDLTVTLRSGEILRGTRVPSEYVLTLRDAQGVLRAISLAEIVAMTSSTSISLPPSDIGRDAFGKLPSDYPVEPLGKVKLETDPEGVLLAAEQLDPEHTPIRELCLAPCTTELAPGRYAFHARGGVRDQRLGMDMVKPGDTVRITINNRAGLRVGGAIMLALGSAVGGTILSQREDAEGNVSNARVAGGVAALVLGLGAAVTMFVYPSSQSLRVFPSRR